MLAAKRSAGVAPEVDLWECVTYTPPPSANKAAYSDFETQRRHQQKGYQWPHKKGLMSSKNLQKNSIANKCEERRNVLISFPTEAPSCWKSRVDTHQPSLYMAVIHYGLKLHRSNLYIVAIYSPSPVITLGLFTNLQNTGMPIRKELNQ